MSCKTPFIPTPSAGSPLRPHHLSQSTSSVSQVLDRVFTSYRVSDILGDRGVTTRRPMNHATALTSPTEGDEDDWETVGVLYSHQTIISPPFQHPRNLPYLFSDVVAD